MNNNQVTVQDKNEGAVSISVNQEAVYTNIKPATKSEKMKLFNQLSRATGRLNDLENEILEVTGFYIQQFMRKDKDTGEPRKALRTTIFTKDGKAYITMSSYFATQFIRFAKTFGDDLADGIKIKIVKLSKEGMQGQILQFEVVSEE